MDQPAKAAWLLSLLILALAAPVSRAQMTPENQAQPQTHEPSPREVVERLWISAMLGELLHPEGLKRNAGLFARPGPSWQDRGFKVFSNEYWVDRPRFSGTAAKVIVWYDEIGTIDSALRFGVASPHGMKTALDYSLTFSPSYTRMFASDGKTLLREVEGLPEWLIDTPSQAQMPWTSVNGAIRYVLERRNKTSDPAIKSNADKTIATLLKYH